MALLENGRLEEYNVERNGPRNIVGSVYKGKVKNIEIGLKAMFVDIGFEKNAFLHFWDAIPAALDSGIEEIDRPEASALGKRSPQRYTEYLSSRLRCNRSGNQGPDWNEGAAGFNNLSFAGRSLVLMPFSDRSGISRKIEEPERT